MESLQIEADNENWAWSEFERGICSDYGNQSQETLCLVRAVVLAPPVTLVSQILYFYKSLHSAHSEACDFLKFLLKCRTRITPVKERLSGFFVIIIIWFICLLSVSKKKDEHTDHCYHFD